MSPYMSLEDVRACVKKTIDDCFAQIVADRPSVELTAQQQLRLTRHIDDLAALFMEVRLRNR